jgi:hypothetical protein
MMPIWYQCAIERSLYFPIDMELLIGYIGTKIGNGMSIQNVTLLDSSTFTVKEIGIIYEPGYYD